MNGLERCRAAIQRRVTDWVPVVPENYMFAIHHCGHRMNEVVRDGKLLAQCLIDCLDEFDYDGVCVDLDNACSAEALGCPVEFRDDDPAVAIGPAISSLEEIDRLKAPDPARDGRMHVYVECVQYLSERIGREKYITAFADQGPFSLAALVRGTDTFMLDLVDPAQAERLGELIELCRKAGEVFALALIAAGAHEVSFGDSIASPDMISPALYERFAFPAERRLLSGLKGRGAEIGLHICGDTTRILPLLAEVGADLLDIDSKTDLRQARAALRGKAAIRGPIDPVSVLRYGDEQLVAEKCREAIDIWGRDGGLILSGGCDIMPGTPPANLKAMVETARSGI